MVGNGISEASTSYLYLMSLTAGLGCSSHHFDSVCRLYQGTGNFWMAPFFSSDFGGWWAKVSWVPESGQIYWHKFRFLKGYRVHIDAPFFSQPWGDCLCWLNEAFNEIKTQEQELEEAREEVWKEPTYPWRFVLVVPSIFSDLKPPVLQILRIKVVKDKVYHQPYKSDGVFIFHTAIYGR